MTGLPMISGLPRAPAWWRRASDDQRDAALAIGAAAVCLVVLLVEPVVPVNGVSRPPDAVGCLLVLTATLPLAVRRRAPVLILPPMLAASIAAVVLSYGASLTLLVSAFAVTNAVVHSHRPLGLPLAGMGALLALAAPAVEGIDSLTPLVVLGAMMVGALPATAGLALRAQRALNVQLADSAAQALIARGSELRAVVAEERTRIAQDVHDIVGHHLSAIVLQAGAGRRTAAQGCDQQAAGTFATIEELGSAALRATGRTLDALRSGSPELTPLPGLADLPELIQSFQAAGVDLDVRVDPVAAEVPPALQTSLYRMTQEALTNVTKHARPRRAALDLQQRDGWLRLTVVSPLPPDSRSRIPDPGHGLIGMRERATFLGGQVDAGPSGDSWTVRAELPLGRAR